MKLEVAQRIAQKYLDLIRPLCLRAEIAGSIRRKMPEVKDVEIVAIRNVRFIDKLKSLVDSWEKCKGQVIGKYCQRRLPEGIKLDLFFADKYNWGNIFLIRTGPWEFSKYQMDVVARKNGFIQKGGYLWSNSKNDELETYMVPVQEESDWFRLMHIPFVEPENRK